MNGLNLDPGLRQAYTQQTHQRLLVESTNARLAKSIKTRNPDRKKAIQFSLVGKLKVIGQIIQDSGSDIVYVIKAKNGTMAA